MTRYCAVENSVVTNVALADESFAAANGLIACDAAGPGWLYLDGVFSPPPQDLEAIARQIRLQRDTLLTSSDWRIIKATETGVPLSSEWISYRQALRDITMQPGFPTDVTWPTEPA